MKNPGVIYVHQAPISRKILVTVNAFAHENWWAGTVLPRWHIFKGSKKKGFSALRIGFFCYL
jgi:hypothetical protein